MNEHAAELKRLRGMTLIAEDAQIRPAAMSHVKPSEYRYYAERAMQQMVDDIATHATALSTVQDLHREAVAQRDQVTRELEEAKVQLSIARAESKCFKDEVDEAHALAKHWIELHITARRDALHEAKAKVETLCIDRDRQCFDCGDSDRDYLAQQILALLGAEP